MIDQPCPVYSWGWASEVYEAFTKRYPRATDALAGVYRLRPSHVIKWIQRDQTRWNAYKKTVKYLEDHSRDIGLKTLDKCVVEWIVSDRNPTWNITFPPKDPLTREKRQITLFEQG